MATYKGINGFAVQSVASDPSPSNEGQVWYNNATYAFKLAAVTTAGTWASGGTMGTARIGAIGVGATASAALKASGRLAPLAGTTVQAGTEEYDGTSWTAGGNMNTARVYQAGCGTQTAALIFGGTFPTFSAATESYNGTSWTSQPSMNTARQDLGGSVNGTQTAALGFGGYNPGIGPTPTGIANTESYDGSSWTTVTALPSARFQVGGVGTQTATLGFGGYNGGTLDSTIVWNGSSWTAGPTMAFGSRIGGWFGSSSNDAVVTNGPTTSSVQTYNGVWASATSLATGRSNIYGGGGTGASGVISGGNSGSVTGVTEEWTGPGTPVTKTITTS